MRERNDRSDSTTLRRCRILFSAAMLSAGALVFTSIDAFAADLVIPNSGFEQGTDKPLNWTFENGDGGLGEMELNTTKAFAGTRAVRMRKTNVPGYSAIVSDFIPVSAGQSYEVKAQVHVEGRSRANVYFMVSQYAADSGEMRLPNAFSMVKPLYTGDGWKPVSLVFPVREGNTRIRIHAIVAAGPIDTTWDEFTLRETNTADAEYKPRFEKPVAEPLPPLDTAIAHLQRRKPAVVQRRMVGNRARFFIDGKMSEPVFYVSPFVRYTDAQIADFKKAGVRLYLVPLVLGRGVYGDFGPWLGKDKYDWQEVDDRLWRILRVDPDANILFYMATDPYLSWANEHPDAIVRDQHGQKVVVDMHQKAWGREPVPSKSGYQERWGHSYVSTELRNDTAKALRELIRHVESSLPGKAVAGYHIAGGNDGQFFHWAGYKPGETDFSAANYHLADYSPASQHAFRDWLRRRYGTEAALRKAWNRPDVTFANAAIPSGERRMQKGFLFDAKKDEDIADYNRFYSEGTVETIQGYARIIKQATGNRKLVSTYWEDTAANVNSHFATAKMLQSNDIDFLAGPTDYGVRMPGEIGEAHSIWGSVGLHGRIWVSEQDYRSWLSGSVNKDYDRSVGRAENATDHNNMVRRESGMMLAFGQGTWWYDMNGGWFRDDGIMQGITEARKAFTYDLASSERPHADVAVFVSERSLDYLTFEASIFRHNAIVQQIRELNRSGVPYHIYLQNDLANPKLPDYKLYVFLNAHDIQPNEWQVLQKLRRNNKTFCFIQAPGVIKPEVVGAQDATGAIEKVTGIKVRPLPGLTSVATAAIADVRKSETPFPVEGLITSLWAGQLPSYAVNDPAAKALGTYSQLSDQDIAIAVRDFGSWKSMFFGGVGMSDMFFNALARYSGAWVAGDAGDAIFASQHFMTVHALWDSEKTVNLLRPSRITDLTTGNVLGERATALKFPMKQGETRWFHLTPQ